VEQLNLWKRAGFLLIACFSLLMSAAAQSDQCSLTLSFTPAPPIPFGQPATITVNRNFPAQLTVTAPVSLDGQQFCTYANPFIDPQDNTCPTTGTVFNNLSIGDHTASWTCTVLNDPFAGPPVSGSQTLTIGPPPPEEGSVNPKFLILSVIYAPPGSKSSVDYGTSTALGNTTDIKSTFGSNTTISGTLGFGPKDIPKDNVQSQVTITASGSHSYTQTKINESSISVNKTTTSDIIVKGPASSSDGINHDFDIILLWINPRIDLTIAQTTATTFDTQWNGYTFDPRDPANEVDVVPVYVGWLKNPSTMPSGVAAALARNWALPPVDGSGPGLTQPDFNLILSKDPFASGSTAIDPTRFLPTGQTFSFAPPPSGGQPATEKFSLAYQAISTDDTTTSDETKYTFTVDGSVTFFGLVTATFEDSHFTDIIHSVQQVNTQTDTQKAALTLTGPTTGYTGPTDLQVFQDKIYGTFMFSFVPETLPGFSLSGTPATQLVVPGGTATYTISASSFNGFSGSIDLSASGMPIGCGPVVFSPASIGGGAGSATMSVPACSTPGNFTITLTGTSGSLTDTTSVSLDVTSAPFLLLASPEAESVVKGDSTTYTVSSLQSPGFTGAITLNASGLPTNTTGSFNPAVITGAATSILTLTTSTATPSGRTSPTITGTSGSSQGTTKVDLVVSDPGGQTGPGCSVAITVNPLAPVEGTPVTYSATVTTVTDNSADETIFLDGVALCVQVSACSVTQNAPPTGTHALQWSCNTGGQHGSGTGAGSQTFGVAAAGVAESGSIKPKYAVLSVIYAPPGQTSFVDYGASTALGTTSSIDKSFSDKTTTSVTLGAGFTIAKIIKAAASVTKSKAFTQTTDTISSIAVKKTDTFDVKVPGPADGADGINHDFDVILVWLNPVVQFTLTGNNTAQWTGLGFDGNDPANEVDVVPLYVSWLKNPSTMPPDIAAALARTWADPNIDGTGPGLTGDDLLAILQRDPFSDPAYVLSLAPGATTSDDKRFDLQIGETMAYEPPPMNGQPFTETFGLNYQTTQTEGLKATDEFTVGFSVEFSADVTIPIATWLTINLNAKASKAREFDWKNVATQTASQANTQSATVSLTGPATGYTGPTDLQVFKDNVYGTFMFAFNPFSSTASFILWTPTDSQTVAAGGVTTYSISTLSLSGFTGNVALSFSGAPAGITGSFSPSSISGTGFSTLTIDVNSSVAAGTYPLTISGTGTGPSGTLTDSTVINVVVAPADFELTGSPASQTTTPGLSATYAISSIPIAGFPGTINLAVTGLPAGVSASFSPTSISGVGTSNLTVNVAPGTTPGSYLLVISGTSGGITQTEGVTLVVTAAPFFLTPVPAAHDIVAGETTTYTVSSTPLGGFSGPVQLSVSGLPPGATATISPSSVSGNDFFIVRVNTTFETTRVGSYPLTFTGTGGGQQYITSADLLIAEPFQSGFCAVDISVNPSVPVVGQPVTITANVIVPSGITAVAGIAFDNQQFCGASQIQPCVQPTGPLTAGSHTVRWSCTTGSGGTGNGSQILGVGTPASINPKYQVLSVIYAPPGQSSTVDYGSSTVLGTSVSFADTLSAKTSKGATLSGELDYKIPSDVVTKCPKNSKDPICYLDYIFQFKASATSTESFSQTLEDDLSIAISKTRTSDIQVPGPHAPLTGINHDFDVILLWINPAANLIITGPTSLLWNGFTFDPNDPVNEVDVVPVYVSWLKDPSLMPPGVRQALSREWADDASDGSGRGLTDADFANILARDPFANGSADIDPTRFVLTGETFSYTAPPNGGQPITEQLALSYQIQAQDSETVKDTYAVGYSVKSAPADLTDVKNFLKGSLKPFTLSSSSDKTITLTNSAKRQNNQTTNQTATLSLAGPAAGYTGPTDLQVYRDSVYGTFMFSFVQSTSFHITTTASAQTTSAGGNVSYPVSLTSFTGLAGPVVFSTKGLPLGATSSFSPSSLVIDSATTLTVNTTTSVPVGVYPFSILGTITTATGHETHSASATLFVVPTGGFLLSVSPGVQIIQSGDTTSYEVSVHAAPGFAATVNLSANNFAMADTATFSPASVTGIGTSTMTVFASPDAPIGSFTITIVGSSSGLPQATTQTNLVVTEVPAPTGIGCTVTPTVNPPAPVPDQLVTYTAEVQGLAQGDSATVTLNLDHAVLCTGASSCFKVDNPPPSGTHVLEWSCTRTGPSGDGTGSGTQPFSVGTVAPSGSLNPKYVVLSVIYTPPGQKSTVDYGTSTQLGSSTSITNSFQGNGSLISKVGPPVPKSIDPTSDVPTSTRTRSLTEKTDSNRQITINKSSAFDIQVPGLDNPTDGINHDYDIILLWLNPVIDFAVAGNNTGQIPGYSFDPNDPANEADVVPVYVKWLKDALKPNPVPLPPGIADALARRWANPMRDGSSPGLTTDDFVEILKRDPFANGVTTIDPKRFDLQGGETFPYIPPPSGGQPISQKFSIQYQATSSIGKTATDEYEVGFGIAVGTNSGDIGDLINNNLNASGKLTWTHSVQTQTTDVLGQTATLSLTGPCFGYVGPTDVQVYQDNIYGTFMFSFVNGPTASDFSLCAAPSSLAIKTGSNDKYTISTSPINGFTSDVSLSVSGLPAGVTATFSVNPIPGGAGSSDLTLTVSPSAAAGTYPLVITGIGGNITHTMNVTLTVKAVPVFALSATPATQVVAIGGNTTYSVSSTALNGLTGDVALTVTGLPAGTTAAFSPAIITGSTGTSTLTISTSGVTPPAISTLTIKGVNGTVQQTTSVTLNSADFTLTGSPATQQVVIGGSTTYTVTSTAVNGLTGNVGLSVSGLPAGATAVFSPTSITGSTGSSTLTVTTTGTTPAANSTLTITGTNGSLAHTATVTLNVADFTVAVTPSSQTVVAGGSTTYTVTTTAVNGFSGTLTPTVSGLPTGATASFSPATITGAGTSTMTVTTSSTTSAANSTLTVTGTSSPRTRTAAGVILGVTDFSIALAPASQTVTVGGSTTYTITVTALNGFAGSIPLNIASLPAGSTGTFSPTSLPGAGTSTLTVTTTSGTTPIGTTNFTVTGNNGGTPTHSATGTLVVQPNLVILRPTVDTATNFFGYANPANAQDGNAGTFASGLVEGGGFQGRSGESWSGFGAGPSPRTQVNLKITSAGNCGDPNDMVELYYSLNGGSTWNTIYAMGLSGGACTNRPLQTDIIPLAAGQDLTQVQVRGLFDSAGSSSHQIYDAWIEVQ
jgi:hypothetical protein